MDSCYVGSMIVATFINATLNTSWLFHLAYINTGPNAPTIHIPLTCNVSANYQCLYLRPRFKHWPSSLIPFVSTS
jgi:hypothetical protein